MNRLIKNLLNVAFIATLSFLFGQDPTFNLLQTIPLPETKSGSNWDCIAVNSIADIYLLDRERGEIIRLALNGDIMNQTGGIGNDDLSFSDPVDLIVSNLDVLVSDRMENQITWFDRKLEFITTDKHAEIFPVRLINGGMDVFYIVSKEQGVIWRRNFAQWDSQEYIDLMQNVHSPECIEDVAVKPNGNLGILYCDGSIFEYNPLGRLIRRYPYVRSKATMMVGYNESWLMISTDGSVKLGINDEQPVRNLPVKDITDVSLIEGKLFILTKDGIHVFSE